MPTLALSPEEREPRIPPSKQIAALEWSSTFGVSKRLASFSPSPLGRGAG